MSEIKDLRLAPSGEKKISWAWRYMPLLQSVEKEFRKSKPFNGLRITASLHIEAKSACLCRVLQAGGAEICVTGCNPLSTQDDVAAALATGMETFAFHGCSEEEYNGQIAKALEFGPHIIIDDGGDLVSMLHRDMKNLIPDILGGCEETTTGIIRLHAMEKAGALKFPMIDVNNARCKHFFDNRYGTGQSVWDGINRATNLVVAGKTVVVAGYGWCGRGIAIRAKGLGARVIITEIDPVKALEAMMDGYDVMPMDDAAPLGEIFVTSTGCCDVITKRHFDKIRDGAILANGGHFNVEIDVNWLEKNAVSKLSGRDSVTRGYTLESGRTIFVIAEGRLVNLASGDGHPVEIMDMSFAIQALSAKYVVENRDLSPAVYAVPDDIDFEVARRKLSSSGMRIDVLTSKQEQYLNSWMV